MSGVYVLFVCGLNFGDSSVVKSIRFMLYYWWSKSHHYNVRKRPDLAKEFTWEKRLLKSKNKNL